MSDFCGWIVFALFASMSLNLYLFLLWRWGKKTEHDVQFLNRAYDSLMRNNQQLINQLLEAKRSHN